MILLSILQTCRHCSPLPSHGLSHPVSLVGATWVSWDKEVTVLAWPPQLLQPEQPPVLSSPSPLPPLSPVPVVSENTFPITAEWQWDLHYSATSSHQFYNKGNLSLLSWVKSISQVSHMSHPFQFSEEFYVLPNILLDASNSKQQMGLQKLSHLKKNNNMRNSILHHEKQFILHHFKK